MTRMRRPLIIAAALLGLGLAIWAGVSRSRGTEVDRLTGLLAVSEGATVAEIGAGSGWLTVEVARRLGASSRVYATELSSARVDDIRQAAASAGLSNVTVLQGAEGATSLPDACCDAIYMRRVFHHFSSPSAMLGSIRAALRPGGRLVIIEFTADGVIGRFLRMGVNRTPLVETVAAAGFEPAAVEDWPGLDHYVAVFTRR